MKKLAAAAIMAAISIMAGCTFQCASPSDMFREIDITPPKLSGTQNESDTAFRIRFDEKLGRKKDCSISINGKNTGNFEIRGTDLRVFHNHNDRNDYPLKVSGRICDERGNRTWFDIEIPRYNSDPAYLVINEFTTRGTGEYPDRVELLVIRKGWLTGITVGDGPWWSYGDRAVLDERFVDVGEYITIYFNNGEDIPHGCYRTEKQKGLGGNNGTIVVSWSQDESSEIMDALIYSDGESVSYGGMGTRDAQIRADLLRGAGEWKGKPVSTRGSTATRSMNRRFSDDIRSCENWYVTRTKGATFGRRNDPGIHEEEN